MSILWFGHGKRIRKLEQRCEQMERALWIVEKEAMTMYVPAHNADGYKVVRISDVVQLLMNELGTTIYEEARTSGKLVKPDLKPGKIEVPV